MVKIPPKYFWPGMVIALLSMTVVFNVVVYNVANSGIGAQPVENYYGKAVNYDALKSRERAAENLGFDWQIGFVDAAGKTRQVELVVTDRQSQPVEGLEATVELRRPSLAQPVATGDLASLSDKPGRYVLAAPVDRPGLWDVVIDGTYNDVAFRKTVRIEFDARAMKN